MKLITAFSLYLTLAYFFSVLRVSLCVEHFSFRNLHNPRLKLNGRRGSSEKISFRSRGSIRIIPFARRHKDLGTITGFPKNESKQPQHSPPTLQNGSAIITQPTNSRSQLHRHIAQNRKPVPSRAAPRNESGQNNPLQNKTSEQFPPWRISASKREPSPPPRPTQQPRIGSKDRRPVFPPWGDRKPNLQVPGGENTHNNRTTNPSRTPEKPQPFPQRSRLRTPLLPRHSAAGRGSVRSRGSPPPSQQQHTVPQSARAQRGQAGLGHVAKPLRSGREPTVARQRQPQQIPGHQGKENRSGVQRSRHLSGPRNRTQLQSESSMSRSKANGFSRPLTSSVRPSSRATTVVGNVTTTRKSTTGSHATSMHPTTTTKMTSTTTPPTTTTATTSTGASSTMNSTTSSSTSTTTTSTTSSPTTSTMSSSTTLTSSTTTSTSTTAETTKASTTMKSTTKKTRTTKQPTTKKPKKPKPKAPKFKLPEIPHEKSILQIIGFPWLKRRCKIPHAHYYWPRLCSPPKKKKKKEKKSTTSKPKPPTTPKPLSWLPAGWFSQEPQQKPKPKPKPSSFQPMVASPTPSWPPQSWLHTRPIKNVRSAWGDIWKPKEAPLPVVPGVGHAGQGGHSSRYPVALKRRREDRKKARKPPKPTTPKPIFQIPTVHPLTNPAVAQKYFRYLATRNLHPGLRRLFKAIDWFNSIRTLDDVFPGYCDKKGVIC